MHCLTQTCLDHNTDQFTQLIGLICAVHAFQVCANLHQNAELSIVTAKSNGGEKCDNGATKVMVFYS